MIRNDSELATISQRVSNDLQQIQRYLGRENKEQAIIKFPRGYMRYAVEFKRRLWFLTDIGLKKNLAYAHMVTDVFGWVLNRTDLYGVPRGMIIKQGICLFASICESIVFSTTSHIFSCGTHRKFSKRCEDLTSANIVSGQLCGELIWLWSVRDNQHIFLAEGPENDCYSLTEYNRAVRAMQSLQGALDAYYKNIEIPF